VLSDIKETTEPSGRAKRLIIFSSPNPARYKETMKNQPTITYIMPTWSEEELICVDKSHGSWYEKFVLFGGVPRLVLSNKDNDALVKLEVVIKTKGKYIAENFFKGGFGDLDNTMSYLVLHINPTQGESGWIYTGECPVYSFASDAIFQRIARLHGDMLLASAITIFNSGIASSMYGGASAGHYFEKICLWLVPVAEKSIRVQFFDRNDTDELIHLPSLCLLPDNIKYFILSE
jgi:hypothetical protein